MTTTREAADPTPYDDAGNLTPADSLAGVAAMNTDLAKAQIEFDDIPLDSEGQAGPRRYKYASLKSCLIALRPSLNRNGFAVSWEVIEATPAKGRHCLTIFRHSSGQSMSTGVPVYSDEAMQSLGSAITYAKRYGLLALAGETADTDDDGAAAGSPATTTRPRRQKPWTDEPTGPPADQATPDQAKPAAAAPQLTFELLEAYIERTATPVELQGLVERVAAGAQVPNDPPLFARFIEAAGQKADARVQAGTWSDADSVTLDRRLRALRLDLQPKQKKLIK
jgi:hypothetical protein